MGVNLLVYAAFLVMLGVDIDPKAAMSVGYVFGIVLGFVLNRRWSFGRRRVGLRDVLSYLVVYLAGYLLNLAGLVLFVDGMDLAPGPVQAAMVFIVAAFTFLMQKHWVFRAPAIEKIER